MPDESKLFRDAAKHPSHALNRHGEIILVRPVSFSFLTAAALVIALIIVGFFIWGTYTKRSTVTGQLVPDLGLIKVYAPQSGTIIEKHVAEGEKIKKGDVLYVLSSERRSTAFGDMHAMISAQVELRRNSFDEEISKIKQLENADLAVAQKKLTELKMEFKKLGELMEGQRQRVTLAEETETRYKNLQQLGYISQDQFLERQSDLLDQRMRLQTLQRDQINLQRQITDQQSLIDTTPIKYKNQIAEIDRAISSGEQEQSQSEAQREWVVLAPETGTATAVIGEVGQSVDPNRALIAVVPEGAKLQAQLYAPSRSIGFVRPGDSVYLRYQAYPYQKFGHYLGTVDSVSKATLSASELGGANPSAAANSGASGSNEPLYRLTVNLAQQTVNAYGLQHVLQAGMLVDADVLQETRYLYEWVLEPLTTLTGKIH